MRRLLPPRVLLFVLPLTCAVALAASGVDRTPRKAPAVDNPHGAFKEECALCHRATGWRPAQISPKFDHAKFGFALEGAHASTSCMACHTSLEFKKAPTQCISCHEDPHRGELGTVCASCHSSRSFVDRAPMIRAHAMTRFPLSGSHAAVECESCHRPAAQGQMQFVGTDSECRACHLAQYQSAKSPDHVAGGFSQECQSCHGTVAWNMAAVDHDRTGFALTGVHRTTACNSCHTTGTFTALSTACESCHKADYDNAVLNHTAAGFAASACASCHTTTAWAGGKFDHATTGFALTGAHVSAACLSCHANNTFAGTSADCYSCHAANYASAVPDHQASGFQPSACASCHTTTTWAGATFDHDARFFPIYSGRHNGLWASCQTCHTTQGNFSLFSCFGCHPHDDKAGTDSHHTEVRNYSYTSTACYSCHPTGRAGG